MSQESESMFENLLIMMEECVKTAQPADACNKVVAESLAEIYKKTGVMYCIKCKDKKVEMKATSTHDAASGRQFKCEACDTMVACGGVNNRNTVMFL